MTIELKIGRKIYNIDENDIVMDNGACIQVITKMAGAAWREHPVIMSKKLFSDLKKVGFLYTNSELEDIATKKYHSTSTLYKFDIDRMKQAGY